LVLLGLAAVLVLAPGAGVAPAGVAEDLAVLLSHPHRLVDSSASLTLRPQQLQTLVRVEGDQLVVDSARFGRILRARFPDPPARSARLQVDGDRVSIVPAASSRVVDVEATVESLIGNPGAAAHRVIFRRAAPDVTTNELAALRIHELISEFTTYFPAGEPRVVNIRRAAELLDGRILAAGATFSMNRALGERTTARGFVPAPTIYGDRFIDSVGGGISQVATTLYNAAFFAGLDLVEHTPHSLYIDRYPMGREATISWGSPDLVFRNDWKAALLMKFDITDTSITVRFYSSSLGRRVETTTGTPYAWIGGTGFSVDYTRRVYAEGRLLRDERFQTRYNPQPTVGAHLPNVEG
jgi:hypothetical protein